MDLLVLLRSCVPPRRKEIAATADKAQKGVHSHLSLTLLDLPSELLFELVGCCQLLSPKDLCAVALSCTALRPLAEHDSFWGELFERRFPRLTLLLEATPPQWWAASRGCAGGGGAWKARYGALCAGAPFAAQVFDREQDNEHEDFSLSCYDALMCLAPACRGAAAAPAAGPPAFVATYHAMGEMSEVVEEGVAQDRLRAPPPGTSPYEIYRGSACGRLQVGEEVEVQWKGRRDHPMGWWLGTVQAVRPGVDRVSLIFQQYPEGSVWRRVKAALRPGREGAVNGDCSFGFVGGLRRLSPAELAEWRRHCPEPPVAPPAGDELAEWSDGEDEEADNGEPGPAAPGGGEGEAPAGPQGQHGGDEGVVLLGLPHGSGLAIQQAHPSGA